jgi:hypothetical protein
LQAEGFRDRPPVVYIKNRQLLEVNRVRTGYNALVPESESTFFKISPPPASAQSSDWLLTPLPNGSGGDVSADDFRVSVVANEQALAEQQKRIAALSAVGSEFELRRKTEAICIAGREIILQCAGTDREARLALLREFCRLYARVENVEKQVAQLLKTTRQDTVYSGKMDKNVLPEFERLADKNRTAMVLRIEYAEIKRAVAESGNSRQSGKLLSELLDECQLEIRLELLDEEIEIAEEVYSNCVERLSDFDYFWREYWAEIWIIVILLVELGEFYWEIYLQLPKQTGV